MPYYYTDYFANVGGYNLVRVSVPNDTGSWVDGQTLNIGSPSGQAVIYRPKSYTFLDNKVTGTLISDLYPFTSASYPLPHPLAGTPTLPFFSGMNFGYFTGVGVPAGTPRDLIPTVDQFLITDTNYSSSLPIGTKIYNKNVVIASSNTNFTSSWREIANTNITGTGVGNAYTDVIPTGYPYHVIYSFGGELLANTPGNYVQFFTASVNPGDVTKLVVSRWYRQDPDGNFWTGDTLASATPNPASFPLTIPIDAGVKDGAAATDSNTLTVYFGGGVRPLYVGATSSIWGYENIYGWRYNATTGRLTGSAFVAGVMPMGRYAHEMIMANGFLYLIGGATGTYDATGSLSITYHNHIDRALISTDGYLTDWQTCAYEIPGGVADSTVGTGLVDGGVFIYPDNPVTTATRNLLLIGGKKQLSTRLTRSSAQTWAAELDFIPSTSRKSDLYRINTDPAWMGPAPGEYQTRGPNLGPDTIRPVLPFLENVYQRLISTAHTEQNNPLPVGNSPVVGYRPGLKNTDINGVWRVKFATTPGNFNPNGDINTAGFARLTASQVYVRQVRLEFLVDTARYGELSTFNPARERLYKKGSTGMRNGRRMIDAISGTFWWDAGTSYIYSSIDPEYGRTVGISTASSDAGVAVFTRLTGALAVALTGTPNWFLNPPPGEGISGLPYIPLSSASLGETGSLTVDSTATLAMIKATVDQQLPFQADNTLGAYLSRIKALQTTNDLYYDELYGKPTGSYF